MRVAAAAGIGLRRQDVLLRSVVQRVVEARDHPHGVAEGRMRRDVLDALAVDPDLAAVAQAFEVLRARQRTNARRCRSIGGVDGHADSPLCGGRHSNPSIGWGVQAVVAAV